MRKGTIPDYETKPFKRWFVIVFMVRDSPEDLYTVELWTTFLLERLAHDCLTLALGYECGFLTWFITAPEWVSDLGGSLKRKVMFSSPRVVNKNFLKKLELMLTLLKILVWLHYLPRRSYQPIGGKHHSGFSVHRRCINTIVSWSSSSPTDHRFFQRMRSSWDKRSTRDQILQIWARGKQK